MSRFCLIWAVGSVIYDFCVAAAKRYVLPKDFRRLAADETRTQKTGFNCADFFREPLYRFGLDTSSARNPGSAGCPPTGSYARTAECRGLVPHPSKEGRTR